ncbi:MAG: lysophospholipase [Deltaproteobacteria bacterium]|nr:lysophospholipase [Deltaproteobacteria bacterium]
MWKAEQPCNKVIVIAHGLGEHSGRYEHVAEFLNNHGYSVYALDHRGHGKSSGRRGRVSYFKQYVQDLKKFTTLIQSLEKNKKIILLGHSMGGLIVLSYLLEEGEGIDSIILSSPALGVNIKGAFVKKAAAQILTYFLPNITLYSEINTQDVLRDKILLLKTIRDRLIVKHISPRLYTELVKTMKWIYKNAHKIKHPLLLLQAGDDKVCVKEKALEFIESVKSGDKTIKVYENFYHEVFNDVERDKVFVDMLAWLEKR